MAESAAPPSDIYSHGHHDSVLRSHGWRTAANSAGYLLPHLRRDHRLLDVGTGPGTITCDLASRLLDGTVTGIDNAVDAVDATRELARRTGVNNLAVEVGDVYRLGYDDEAFDVVHAHQVLQHLSDPVAALREMRRVCRATGLVAVRDADYAAMAWFPESRELTRWSELYRSVARANRGEPDAGRRLKGWALSGGFPLSRRVPRPGASPRLRTWGGGRPPGRTGCCTPTLPSRPWTTASPTRPS